MKTVYLLTHAYELDGCDEVKIIGAYGSEKDAKLAVRRKRRWEGFRDHPKGFHIACLEIGRDQWSEGFITMPAFSRKKSSRTKAR